MHADVLSDIPLAAKIFLSCGVLEIFDLLWLLHGDGMLVGVPECRSVEGDGVVVGDNSATFPMEVGHVVLLVAEEIVCANPHAVVDL